MQSHLKLAVKGSKANPLMSVLNRYRERGEVYEKYPAALYTGVKNEVCGIYHTYHTVLGTRDDRTSGRVRLILVESHSKRSRRLRCGGGEGWREIAVFQ